MLRHDSWVFMYNIGKDVNINVMLRDVLSGYMDII
jgi:hypothetical protein